MNTAAGLQPRIRSVIIDGNGRVDTWRRKRIGYHYIDLLSTTLHERARPNSIGETKLQLRFGSQHGIWLEMGSPC